MKRCQTAAPIRAGVEGVPRVLIVDDDASALSAMVEALSLDRRYKIEAAPGSYEGLIKVETFQPHLLILDLRLPGLSGFQVCRRVKADPATHATRILAITGYAEWDAREGILEAGADGFLEKPFELTELRAQAARLIGLRPGDPPKPLSLALDRPEER
ncbi:MAG: two-component system response regulator [Candidatus Methylomirabilia bacterium]